MLLRIKSCTATSITFALKREDISETEVEFDFDFRFYVPYHGDEYKQGGLYVFKTTDKDSAPYIHTLKQVLVFDTKKAPPMFLLSFKNRVSSPSQVKIRLLPS